jgi:hypothetical protein
LSLENDPFELTTKYVWVNGSINIAGPLKSQGKRLLVEYDFLSSNLFNHQWPGNLQVRWATILLIPIQREGKPLISALATEAIIV